MEKDNENDRCEQEAKQNCVAHALDRLAHDDGLVIEGLDLDSRRQRFPDLIQRLVYFAGDIERVAIGLAIDVEQDGGFAVCGNDPVNGLHSGNDLAEITDAHRDARRCGLYDHGRNLGGRADLSADQSQDELMITFKQAG